MVPLKNQGFSNSLKSQTKIIVILIIMIVIIIIIK